jgi:hypothetical protein
MPPCTEREIKKELEKRFVMLLNTPIENLQNINGRSARVAQKVKAKADFITIISSIIGKDIAEEIISPLCSATMEWQQAMIDHGRFIDPQNFIIQFCDTLHANYTRDWYGLDVIDYLISTFVGFSSYEPVDTIGHLIGFLFLSACYTVMERFALHVKNIYEYIEYQIKKPLIKWTISSRCGPVYNDLKSKKTNRSFGTQNKNLEMDFFHNFCMFLLSPPHTFRYNPWRGGFLDWLLNNVIPKYWPNFIKRYYPDLGDKFRQVPVIEYFCINGHPQDSECEYCKRCECEGKGEVKVFPMVEASGGRTRVFAPKYMDLQSFLRVRVNILNTVQLTIYGEVKNYHIVEIREDGEYPVYKWKGESVLPPLEDETAQDNIPSYDPDEELEEKEDDL